MSARPPYCCSSQLTGQYHDNARLSNNGMQRPALRAAADAAALGDGNGSSMSIVLLILAILTTLGTVLAVVYAVQQHRRTVRLQFLLWLSERAASEDQRAGRSLLFDLARPERRQDFELLVEGVHNGTLLGDESYNAIRSVLAFANTVGYFWSKCRCGPIDDLYAVFPQVFDIWKLGRPIVEAIRSRPQQENSFEYLEEIAGGRANK
jgi:hypothetical protein